jgi:hypothetical protein
MVRAGMPVTLTAAGRTVRTVFDLLGRRENDLTYALAWGIANVPALARALLADVYEVDVGEPLTVALQEFGEDRGYTDIEIQAERAHLVLEAKRGWVIPTPTQFGRYAPRLAGSLNPLLLALTECSPAYARRRLPAAVGGVPVRHRSWTELVRMIEGLSRTGRHAERRLLQELVRYLRGVMTMQNKTSNWTYVVALNRQTPHGWGISFLDVVLEKNRYFHPYGTRRGGWPKVPPNYIAFRWDGRVRRIHHIDAYKVVDDLNEAFTEIPAGLAADVPHIVYDLGPPIMPTPPLPTGGNYRAARTWAALDLLLTSATLRDAIVKTKERRAAEPEQPL